MITGVIVHLANDLPIMVDLEELPAGGDRTIRCTNVRTMDGKRPGFVHERHSTFILPLGIIRAIEVPRQGGAQVSEHDRPAVETQRATQPTVETVEEEPEEDLLARIRQI